MSFIIVISSKRIKGIKASINSTDSEFFVWFVKMLKDGNDNPNIRYNLDNISLHIKIKRVYEKARNKTN